MNALDEMRADASRMADGDIAVILEMALKRLASSRWFKLRRNLVEPQDDKERAYMSALSTYVYHKLALRREVNFYGYGVNRTSHEIAMNKARNKMDRIEMGVPEAGEFTHTDEIAEYVLSPEMTRPAMVHDSYLIKVDKDSVKSITEAFGSVHRNFDVSKIDPQLVEELLGEPGKSKSLLLAEKTIEAFKNLPPVKLMTVKAPNWFDPDGHEGVVLKNRGPFSISYNGPIRSWSETPGEAPSIRSPKLVSRNHDVNTEVRYSRGEIKGGGEV